MNREGPPRAKPLLTACAGALMVPPFLVDSGLVTGQSARLTKRGLANVTLVELESLMNGAVMDSQVSFRHERMAARGTDAALGGAVGGRGAAAAGRRRMLCMGRAS